MFLTNWSRGGICLLAALFALSPLGCGGSKYGKPDVSISGKVLYASGKPLTTGMIVFSPREEGEEAPMAVIQQDGSFKFSEIDGLPPGEYQVSLAAPEAMEAETETVGSTLPVPKKYLQADTSGWTAAIKESDNEPLTFSIAEK